MIGRYLTRVAELSEHHAARVDDVLREHERDVIAPPTRGLAGVKRRRRRAGQGARPRSLALG